MPLGNLTSQFFANVYLNELDQYVKHKLKAKYYIRYVDDFVIFSQNPNELKKHKENINNFLKNNLLIKLHSGKTKIIKLENGVSFLGVRIYKHHKLLNKKNIRRFNKRLEIRSKEYHNQKLSRETAIDQFQGWLAYSRNANTYKLRRKITSQFNKLFPITNENKIVNPSKHENIEQKIYENNIEYTVQKTKELFKKGLTPKQIAKQRNLKENTIYKHLANLAEHHQIKLKELMPSWKVKLILKNIKSNEDKLKTIKERINKESINYNEIELVLAVIKGKHKKKNATYHIQWYQKVNCQRKCHNNKNQINICRLKFQKLQSNINNLEFTKKEFLNLINNQTNICELPVNLKNKFVKK